MFFSLHLHPFLHCRKRKLHFFFWGSLCFQRDKVFSYTGLLTPEKHLHKCDRADYKSDPPLPETNLRSQGCLYYLREEKIFQEHWECFHTESHYRTEVISPGLARSSFRVSATALGRTHSLQVQDPWWEIWTLWVGVKLGVLILAV